MVTVSSAASASDFLPWADGKWYDTPADFYVPVTICEWRPDVPFGSSVGQMCPGGWHQYLESCYFMIDRPSTHSRAMQRCHEFMGSSLVAISSADENVFVQGFCGNRMCWLGLHEERHSEVWRWPDGDVANYLNWQVGEPDNSRGHDESVAMMHLSMRRAEKALQVGWATGKWYDAPSDFDRPKAICERPGLAGCPSGWDPFGESCYRLLGFHSNYVEAERRCSRGMGSHLVTIGSAEEQQFVKELCGDRICWLGLKEARGTELWSWADGAALADFENWEVGEPNNADGRDESVAIMNFNMEWADNDDETQQGMDEGTYYDKVFASALFFWVAVMLFFCVNYGGVYIAALWFSKTLCAQANLDPGGPRAVAAAVFATIVGGAWWSTFIFGGGLMQIKGRFNAVMKLFVFFGMAEAGYILGVYLGVFRPPPGWVSRSDLGARGLGLNLDFGRGAAAPVVAAQEGGHGDPEPHEAAE